MDAPQQGVHKTAIIGEQNQAGAIFIQPAHWKNALLIANLNRNATFSAQAASAAGECASLDEPVLRYR